jgi:hypothetical protein
MRNAEWASNSHRQIDEPTRVAADANGPITAELAPPPPSPLQFGLRSLMLVMAVCSVQFAVMSYHGVLRGMFLGAAACFFAFSVVFLVGLCLPGRRAADHLKRMDKLVVWLMALIMIMLLGTVLAGGGVIAWDSVARIRNEAWMERSIGASLKRELLVDRNESRWALRVAGVKAGSPADYAGLKKDEVVVVEGTIDKFYKFLQDNRGHDVELTVAVCGPTQSLDKAPQRMATLSVPK